MSAILTRYTNWLVAYPLKSRIITGMACSSTGDFLCQVLVEEKGFGRPKQYNKWRTLRQACISGGIVAPI